MLIYFLISLSLIALLLPWEDKVVWKMPTGFFSDPFFGMIMPIIKTNFLLWFPHLYKAKIPSTRACKLLGIQRPPNNWSETHSYILYKSLLFNPSTITNSKSSHGWFGFPPSQQVTSIIDCQFTFASQPVQ